MSSNKSPNQKIHTVTIIAVMLIAGEAVSANEIDAFIASTISTDLHEPSAVDMSGTQLLLAQAEVEPVPIESNLTSAVEVVACEGSFVGNDLLLAFSGDLGTSANLLRDGWWLATVTGFDSYNDTNASAGASYVLRTRPRGVITDTNCVIEPVPEPSAPMF